MIISDKHKFIFIHVPKTGGMSIKAALAKSANKENHVARQHLITTCKIKKHDKALQIRNYIKPKIWKAYYKFAFVRNPFDWVVSLYYYIRKDKKDPRHALANKFNFKKFIQWFRSASANTYPARNGQKQYVTDVNGSIIVDFIGRFERFGYDFHKVCSDFGITMRVPHINATKHTHYASYYDIETKKCVQDMFKEDITFFEYTF